MSNVKLTHTRRNRRGKFARRSRSLKLLRWLNAQSLRLDSTATSDTFVSNAVLSIGVLTLSGNVVGNDFATGVLTLTGLPLDGETVTIDGKVYTFQDTLTEADGNVHIAGDASDSIDNLIAAINLGAGAGTDYATATTLHPTVSGAAGAGDTMDATAKSRGVAGNSIATVTNLTNGSWGAATLENGVDGDTVTLGTQVYTFNAAPLDDLPDNVLVGASASDSIDNLIAAINGAAGAGTTYGTNTVANGDASAAAGAGDTLDATSLLINGQSNSIATTATGAQASWGAVTLESGVESNTLTATAHGFSNGEGPYQVTTAGTLPTGLSLLTNYWISVVDANIFALRTGNEGGPIDTISNPGSGTQTILKASSGEAMYEILRDNVPERILAVADIDDLA